MKVRWIGHAMFLLTSEDGVRVATDPFAPGCFNGALAYDHCDVTADVVTVSHGTHDDHNAVWAVKGNPAVFEEAGSFEHGGVDILGLSTFHDDQGGAERGPNLVFRIGLDGLRVAHLGDLGHTLDEAQAGALAPVDVTLAPFGGHFTIDGAQAIEVARSLGTKILVPMHFKTPKVDFPIRPLEDFLDGSVPVRDVGEPEVEITRAALPGAMEIWKLAYAG